MVSTDYPPKIHTEVEFNYELKDDVFFDLRWPMAFEVLARTRFLGNLRNIDEHPLTQAWCTTVANEPVLMVDFWDKHNVCHKYQFPPQVLNRFEPIYMRIQMILRKCMEQYDRWW